MSAPVGAGFPRPYEIRHFEMNHHYLGISSMAAIDLRCAEQFKNSAAGGAKGWLYFLEKPVSEAHSINLRAQSLNSKKTT